MNASNPYTSRFDEVDIAPGDSGGPSFYDGEIVGVHDLDVCFVNTQNSSICATPPSLSTSNNSYFGEMYADTSVYPNLNWIQAQEAPEPRTLSLMLGALVASLMLRARAVRRSRG